MSLVCFKTIQTKCLKETFLMTAQCLPSLKLDREGVVSLFRVTMAGLFNMREGFYLSNQRRGSTLRWDKLITLFSEPLNWDKRKLRPQSSHSCTLCYVLSVLYLSQHNAICVSVFNSTSDIQKGKSALRNVQL